jgi:hypothetical protein
MDSEYALTDIEAAERLSLSVATLRAWRLVGRGPRYVKFGRAVRYLVTDLEAFIAESRVEHEART